MQCFVLLSLLAHCAVSLLAHCAAHMQQHSGRTCLGMGSPSCRALQSNSNEIHVPTLHATALSVPTLHATARQCQHCTGCCLCASMKYGVDFITGANTGSSPSAISWAHSAIKPPAPTASPLAPSTRQLDGSYSQLDGSYSQLDGPHRRYETVTDAWAADWVAPDLGSVDKSFSLAGVSARVLHREQLSIVCFTPLNHSARLPIGWVRSGWENTQLQSRQMLHCCGTSARYHS